MPRRLLDRVNFIDRLNSLLERWLPEQRLFIKSDTTTRFVRLRPLTQAMAFSVGGLLFAWAMLATSLLFIDSISSGSSREQASIARSAFEQRLIALAHERDSRANEAMAAQRRFQVALAQVSQMQSQLLGSEERRRELETGIDVIQSTLRRTMTERDDARDQLMTAQAGDAGKATSLAARADDMAGTVDMLADALNSTAVQRDAATRDAQDARVEADQVALQKRLLEERNDQIFTTLEGAVNISLKPLDRMFRNAGMNPDSILAQIRKGYSGTGGPWMPISLSSKNMAEYSQDDMRASAILNQLDEMNMYRMAVDRLPFGMPLDGGFRFTSPFGYRWGRLHAGVDLAGPVGMKIKAPADGTVIDAGWENGYGLMVRVQHQFGVSTIYGHMSRVQVKVGQKVSRGDVISDSGNTGRSTGPHLHYEIRVDGQPINPMTFIKAAQNVF
ncbi:MAG TPA: M23 family metallopeptidase [Paenirhodobacter sp.]